MPLSTDRGLELFDSLRRAVNNHKHTSNFPINVSLMCSAGYPAICFSYLDETTNTQRHVGVNVANSLATQAMLVMRRPSVPLDKSPMFLIPIGDVADMADLISNFLIQNINPIYEHQMKANWKWNTRVST